MAPRSLPPAAKQRTILSWIQNSGTAHSFKDLEKALPSVASISGMQVKEFLQALADDGKIRVEKIGSDNWYWSFLSEDKRTKQATLDALNAEKDKLTQNIANINSRISEAGLAREVDDDRRTRLADDSLALSREVAVLKAELATFSCNNPLEVLKKRESIIDIKLVLDKVTTNILSMERRLVMLSGGDQYPLRQLQEELYGQEYEPDEGLVELDL